MLGVAHWGRQIRFLLGLPATRHYTVEQVWKCLRGGPEDKGTVEVEQMLARLPSILGDARVRRRYDGFQRYLEILPRIVFLYHRGDPVETITAGLPFLATDIGVETVIWTTCQVIAEQLNRAA